MIYILPGHERAVVFTLGRFSGVKGPGLVILIPVVQQMTRVDMRPVTIASGNEAAKVNATVSYRVIDAAKALLQVASYRDAIRRAEQIRSVVDSSSHRRGNPRRVLTESESCRGSKQGEAKE